jgi:hypothetical protein
LTINSNLSAPVADPTVVFIGKQVAYTISSLAMVAATVVLALNHFIQDGEIVTLLVTAVGAHVLASVNGNGTTTTDNSVNTPVQAVPVVQQMPGTVTTITTPHVNETTSSIVTPPVPSAGS